MMAVDDATYNRFYSACAVQSILEKKVLGVLESPKKSSHLCKQKSGSPDLCLINEWRYFNPLSARVKQI